MRQKPPTLVKLVALLALMPICGIVAATVDGSGCAVFPIRTGQ